MFSAKKKDFQGNGKSLQEWEEERTPELQCVIDQYDVKTYGRVIKTRK